MNEKLKNYAFLISEENDFIKNKKLIEETKYILIKYMESVRNKQEEVLSVINKIKEEYNKNNRGYAQTEFKE